MLDDKTGDAGGIGNKTGDETAKEIIDQKIIDQKIIGTTSEVSKMISDSASDLDVVDIVARASQEQLIPWEETTLPSKGLYYGWTSGVVSVRAWSSKIDKILATERLAQSGQSIDYMLRECCRFPDGFDVQDLLVGDQIYLLYYLRGITHGNMYEFAAVCPNQQCKCTSTHSVDLNELVHSIVWADESLGPEPFRVDLPYLSKITGRDFYASVKFLRVRDASNIRRAKKAQNVINGASRVKIKTRNKTQQPQQRSDDITIDDVVTQNIETVIADVNGCTDRFKIRSIVNKMQSTDIAVIREWLTDHTPSLETMVELTCPGCGEAYSAMLPITESFFRP